MSHDGQIRVHIERLVLDGLPVSAAHGPAVRAAVERELSRLLAQGGLAPALSSGGALERMPQASFTMAHRPDPARLGRGIAAAVYGRVGG